jgi:hypothetical protein
MLQRLLPLRTIQERLDELAEQRLVGLTKTEEREYLDLVRLEAEALKHRAAG